MTDEMRSSGQNGPGQSKVHRPAMGGPARHANAAAHQMPVDIDRTARRTGVTELGAGRVMGMTSSCLKTRRTQRTAQRREPCPVVSHTVLPGNKSMTREFGRPADCARTSRRARGTARVAHNQRKRNVRLASSVSDELN